MKIPKIIVAALLLLLPACAHAQVFLKEPGKKAVPARVKVLHVQTELLGCLAVTHVQMRVQNEVNQTESATADFVCSKPPHATLTEFSYGDDSNGVRPARVVKKSVTAAKMSFAPAKNDPLLKSGLNNDDSFRVTMAPIFNYSDLVIKWSWVEILPATRGSTKYTLPLLALCGSTTRLDDLQIKVQSRSRVSNNFSLQPVAGNTLQLSQKNYRPIKDPVVNQRGAPNFKGWMLVSPDAQKGGGYFALILDSPEELSHHLLLTSGMQLLDYSLSRERNIPLFQGTPFVTGRYKGDVHNLTVRAYYGADGFQADVKPEKNSLAASLWAINKIRSLSKQGAKNKAEIIRTSCEHSIASPYTQWLDMISESNNYGTALANALLDSLVREYWMHASDTRQTGAREKKLRNSIARICRLNHLSMQDELFMRLGSALNYAAFRGWYYDRKPRTPDELRFNRLTVQVNQYTERVLGIHKSPSDSYVPAYPAMARLREKIWEEYRKPHPNYRNLDRWENKFAKIYGATTTDPRQILVYTRASALSMEADLRDAENRGDKARQKQLGLERSRNANYMRSALVKNIGDPPIYVSAPANARQVIALMTDGTIKPLEYNAGRKRWEGNYDVPTTTREGRYEIHIIIIQQNGQRREYSVPYQVDTTAPTGNGQATVLSAHDAICLEINHGGDVARVLAILPWGEKVSLLPSTIQGARFYGTAQVPTKYRGKAFRVIYILTDRAHNRTTIEANATP